MKKLILITLATCSCTVVRTKTPNGGEALYASLGGNTQNVVIHSEGASIGSNNNSESFDKAAKAANTITGVLALASVSKLNLSEAGKTDRAGITGETARQGSSEVTARAINANSTNLGIRRVDSNTAVRLKELDTAVDLKKLETPIPEP